MIDYKSQSLANQVYETIERNILNGVYSKGAVISEMKLSEELGVSRTPIREAMTRLETERLIETTSTGTIVVGISDKDVKDMFQVKLHLDPLIMKMAATNISAHALEKLKDNLEQQEFYNSKGNTEKLRDLDTEFHDIIYAESKSPILQHILTGIHHKLLKYRKASLDKSDRSDHSVEEHEAIYEALAARDEMRIELLVLQHINHSYDTIMKGVK
ncbi:MAG: GntR family transcriptional regulator [Firmicutes bacterium]|nr:GntR family transcriptional regulator [Bacillota bacterium]